MKKLFFFSLLALCTGSQAQIVLAPPSGQAQQPVQLIEPSKTGEPVPGGAGKPAVTPETAQPEPIKAPSEKKKKPASPPTIIDAKGGCTIDPKSGIHTFSDQVVVKSPQFDLKTDGKLEVKMKQAAKAPPAPKADADGKGKADPKGKADTKAKSDAPPPAATADKAEEDDSVTSEIDQATATGKRVDITKTGADGKVKTGIGRIVIYDSKVGTLTLKEWPQVQDGPNLIIATDVSTVMVLDKNNNLHVKGPNTTKLMPNDDPNKKKSSDDSTKKK